MPPFRQLELNLATRVAARDLATGTDLLELERERAVVEADCAAICRQIRAGRHPDLEQQSTQLLGLNGARLLARHVRVVWDRRLKSCAGRADYKASLITLNPLLIHHGEEEI